LALTTEDSDMDIPIEGMTCQHCVRRVTEAIRKVPGVTDVRVDLDAKSAHVEGSPDVALVVRSVAEAGYTARPS